MRARKQAVAVVRKTSENSCEDAMYLYQKIYVRHVIRGLFGCAFTSICEYAYINWPSFRLKRV